MSKYVKRCQKGLRHFVIVCFEKTVIWKHESLLWKHDTLYGHRVHYRGAAGVRAGTTRDRHASILSCATVTRARARRSRA